MADLDKLNIDSIIQRLLEVRGSKPEGTMNVPASTEFMDFMMNVKEDTTLNYGKLSQTVLTVYR